MSYGNSANSFVRFFNSKGLAFLYISYFKTYLTFNFRPCIGQDFNGRDKYSDTVFLSTSINYNAAAALCIAAQAILDGNENPVRLIITCSNNTTLTFEFRPDQDNQMAAYFTIDKNNMTIPFRFSTRPLQVRENGEMVTKIIQSGLGVFVKCLDSYLKGIGADLHLNKLTEEELHNKE